MNNFADNKILPKIYSVNGIMANMSRMIIGVIASSILNRTSIFNAVLILGGICTVFVIVMAIYSKSRLGLKPEEYEAKDIDYLETIHEG